MERIVRLSGAVISKVNEQLSVNKHNVCQLFIKNVNPLNLRIILYLLPVILFFYPDKCWLFTTHPVAKTRRFNHIDLYINKIN
jgi:hypothetical protein